MGERKTRKEIIMEIIAGIVLTIMAIETIGFIIYPMIRIAIKSLT